MLEVATDRRRIEAEPDEGAHERAVALGRRFVEDQVALARELCRIEATKTYVAHECVSIEEYGARWIGIAARDARQLVDLGRALDAAATTAQQSTPSGMASDVPSAPPPVAVPTVADAILAGALSVARAALAGRFVAAPELVREGESAVALAMVGSIRHVRTTLRVREEELAQQEKVGPFTVVITERARDGFRRARSLASEAAGAMLTEGETFSLVVDRFLDVHDPARRAEGARRVGDTADLPGQRYVPAEVKRRVRARAGDQCEVPGCCRRTFLELAHIHAHRDGGGREEDDLLLLCHGHHVLFDAGRIRFVGWEDGRATLCGRGGRRLEDRTGASASSVLDETVAIDAAVPPQPVPDRLRTSGPVSERANPADHADASWAPSTVQADHRSECDRRDASASNVAERPPPYGCDTTSCDSSARGPPLLGASTPGAITAP